MKTLQSLCAALAVLASLASPASAQFDGKEKEAIETIVRQYLLDNPEIIREAIEALHEREERAKAAAQQRTLESSAESIYSHPLSPEYGDPKGSAVVVEFFDYQCGYCKRVFPTFLKVMESDKDIRVVWKELPILGPVSRFAARAAMAADRQGKYFDYHVALMSLRGRLTESRVMETAKSVGLDMKKLVDDMASPEIERYLDETLELAQALGINGTPAFVIGDQIVPGAIRETEFRALIEGSRKAKN